MELPSQILSCAVSMVCRARLSERVASVRMYWYLLSMSEMDARRTPKRSVASWAKAVSALSARNCGVYPDHPVLWVESAASSATLNKAVLAGPERLVGLAKFL